MGEGCRGCASLHPEVRAAEESDFNSAVDDQRERDGVLLAPQEAFGAVDRIEGPKPRGEVLLAAPIDPVAGLFAAGFDAHRPQLVQHTFEEGAILLAAQGSRFFLADDRIAREGVADEAADGGLAGEVGDGDGAAILFLEDVGRDFRLHIATDPRGGPDRIQSNGKLDIPPSGLTL